MLGFYRLASSGLLDSDNTFFYIVQGQGWRFSSHRPWELRRAANNLCWGEFGWVCGSYWGRMFSFSVSLSDLGASSRPEWAWPEGWVLFDHSLSFRSCFSVLTLRVLSCFLIFLDIWLVLVLPQTLRLFILTFCFYFYLYLKLFFYSGNVDLHEKRCWGKKFDIFSKCMLPHHNHPLNTDIHPLNHYIIFTLKILSPLPFVSSVLKSVLKEFCFT